MTFDATGTYAASAAQEKAVLVWHVRTGRLMHRLPLAANPYEVRFSPDGTQLAACASDGSVTLWNSPLFTNARVIPASRKGLLTVAYSPDGKTLVTAGEESVVRTWNAATGDLVREFQGHSQRIWTAAFSPDGGRLVTGSADLTARIWDTSRGVCTLVLSDFSEPLYNVFFSPDGNRVYANASGEQMVVFDARPTNAAP